VDFTVIKKKLDDMSTCVLWSSVSQISKEELELALTYLINSNA